MRIETNYDAEEEEEIVAKKMHLAKQYSNFQGNSSLITFLLDNYLRSANKKSPSGPTSDMDKYKGDCTIRGGRGGTCKGKANKM